MTRLRVVGPDERTPDPPGSLQVVLEDLDVAIGHVTEARAEAAVCLGDVRPLDRALVRALDELAASVNEVHKLRGHA